MATAILSSKGQITIPASVRVALGVGIGDRIEFLPLENGGFELVAATLPVTALKGSIAKPVKAISIEAMNAAIARRGSGQDEK